ncbi:hypothetical protein [Methanobrevibacter filiformis]|uniref:Uncharacterized protein n=1 Tax=Methanobrevibacter filiformis TaxID=55758 RepID=A0A165ZA89_9EURY|nr:hypothetical protein [Methanobrevibacter filiformis]KZX10464.1 hypothetical protein MBFIL_17630 [Methanobrevibacter filiformis]
MDDKDISFRDAFRVFWDVDEEREKNKKTAQKILKKFPNVVGLDKVLYETQMLFDSPSYKECFKIYESIIMSYHYDDEKDLENKEIITNMAILSNSDLKYFINLFGNAIFLTNAFGLVGTLAVILNVKLGRKPLYNNVLIFYNWFMVKLDDFHNLNEVKLPNEEFYKKLRKIKWEKSSKKLFDQIRLLYNSVNKVVAGEKISKSTFGVNTALVFSVIFLCGCSAVLNERERINDIDVINAYNTFYKILNVDSEDLKKIYYPVVPNDSI